MEICKTIDDISWRPHPVAEGVTIKPLATKSDDDLNVNIGDGVALLRFYTSFLGSVGVI